MKTLIVYATKYGATEKAAKKLAEQLNGEVDLVNLKHTPMPNVDAYERVIAGTAVYAGTIRGEAKQFCAEYQQTLLQKPFSLFVCCGNEDQAREQLTANLDAQLLEHAALIGSFGYEYDFAKLNFFFKLVIRKVAKVTTSQFNLRDENIRAFAAQLNAA